MTSFISPDTGPQDPDDITADAIAFLQNQYPDWEPSDGHLEVWQIMALARIVSIATQVAGTVPLEIFKFYGQTIIGLPPIGDVPATTTSTWTMLDTQGYTIPAGTNVAFAVTGDTLVAFETVSDVVVPPGSSVTATGGVALQAVDPGKLGNGLGPDTLVLLDALAFVTQIVAEVPTTGGVDAETDQQYASRLFAELQLETATPILGADFAVLARNVPGVTRAVGVDNYNPANGTTNNEKMVGIAAVDSSGNAVSTPVKTAIAAYINTLRELNFICNVFDPTYTTVNVAFSFVVYSGYDPTATSVAGANAISSFLSPATWGVDPADTTGTSWLNTSKVRYSTLIGVLLAVPGIRYVTALTINGSSADLTMSGGAPLPLPGSVTPTVVTS